MKHTTFRTIGTRFLNALHGWHEVQGFELDYRVLAEHLGIEVKREPGARNLFLPTKRRIIIDSAQSWFRERHTGLHEVGHVLFKTGWDGQFLAELRNHLGRNPKELKDAEEALVRLAGLQLLMPRPLLASVFAQEEDDAKRALILARSANASLAAAGQRLAWAVDRAVGGLVMRPDGYVTDFFGNGLKKLGVGRDFVIGEQHPLRQPFSPGRVEYFQAPLPYKKSRRVWRRQMHALADGRRGQIIVFFNCKQGRGKGQPRLFPERTR